MFSRLLFITEVGSRMWGMEEFASDYDLFFCYQTPSSEYLRTGIFERNRPQRQFKADGEFMEKYDLKHIPLGAEIDAQYMEIGHLVGLLKKGNINAIWAVCSPIVHYESHVRGVLEQIILGNLSTASFASINGMAHSQLNDAVKRAAVKDPQKSKATACRTLVFGTNMFNGKGLMFKPYDRETTSEKIGDEFRIMEMARDRSWLPDAIDAHPFEDFLFNLRLREIIENHAKVGVR